MSARGRVVGLTVAAGVLYGGWAFAVNLAHGASTAARAGLVQALSSAFTTLVISGASEVLRRRLGTGPRGLVLAATLPPTATALVHLSAHLLNGTPAVLRTIAPSVIIGYVFAAVYALAAHRSARREPAQA